MEDVEVEYVIIKDVEHGGMYVATKVRIAYRGGEQIRRHQGDRRVLE
jgi:hypothetical protein